MNILLLAFAIPVATVLLAIVLQKVLKCPLLVAATFFAVLLIITYAVFDSSFLVLAILYTILAYVTAVIVRLICNLRERFNLNNNCNNCNCERNANSNVSTGTWCCTSRNNDPVIVLTNANDITNNNNTNNNNTGNNNTGRTTRNVCNCNCRRS